MNFQQKLRTESDIVLKVMGFINFDRSKLDLVAYLRKYFVEMSPPKKKFSPYSVNKTAIGFGTALNKDHLCL